MPPTTSWSETTPAGADAINQGDNRIRELKTQIREVVGVDHDFPSSGSASDNGQHLRCTFQEQANLGTGAVGTTILGSQTVNGKGELVYSDEDNNDIVITKSGKINAAAIGGTYNATSVADLATLLNYIYPVGTVVTLGVSTNPATLFGIGTWTAIAGRVIVGIDAGQTEFDTLNETGGAKTHTLDITEIPAHTHTYDKNSSSAGSAPGSGETQSHASTNTGSAGGGLAHNNLQPYVVKYCWERVS